MPTYRILRSTPNKNVIFLLYSVHPIWLAAELAGDKRKALQLGPDVQNSHRISSVRNRASARKSRTVVGHKLRALPCSVSLPNRECIVIFVSTFSRLLSSNSKCTNDDKALGDESPLGFGFVLHGEVQLELCWQLVFRVQSVREVHSADSAVGVDL